MNTDKHFFRMGLLAVTLLVTASCGQTNSGDASLESTPENAPEIVLKDYGNAPTVLDIEAYTVGNENFRTTCGRVQSASNADDDSGRRRYRFGIASRY